MVVLVEAVPAFSGGSPFLDFRLDCDVWKEKAESVVDDRWIGR